MTLAEVEAIMGDEAKWTALAKKSRLCLCDGCRDMTIETIRNRLLRGMDRGQRIYEAAIVTFKCTEEDASRLLKEIGL